MSAEEKTFVTEEGHTVQIKRRYDESQTPFDRVVPLMLSPTKTVASYNHCETRPLPGGYVGKSAS